MNQDECQALIRENQQLKATLALLTTRHHLLFNHLINPAVPLHITEPLPTFEDTQPLRTLTAPPDTLPL
jgi:hypothetical protein